MVTNEMPSRLSHVLQHEFESSSPTSELSDDTSIQNELPSPEEFRSELSTPEPCFDRTELPSRRPTYRHDSGEHRSRSWGQCFDKTVTQVDARVSNFEDAPEVAATSSTCETEICAFPDSHPSTQHYFQILNTAFVITQSEWESVLSSVLGLSLIYSKWNKKVSNPLVVGIKTLKRWYQMTSSQSAAESNLFHDSFTFEDIFAFMHLAWASIGIVQGDISLDTFLLEMLQWHVVFREQYDKFLLITVVNRLRQSSELSEIAVHLNDIPYSIEVSQALGSGQIIPSCSEFLNGKIRGHLSCRDLSYTSPRLCLCEYL